QAQRPAFAGLRRVQLHHPGRRLGDALERADEVDLERLEEQLDRQVADFSRLAVAPDRLADRPDAGAADQHALLTVSLARPGETGIHRRFVRNVDLAGDAADLLGDRPAPLL